MMFWSSKWNVRLGLPNWPHWLPTLIFLWENNPDSGNIKLPDVVIFASVSLVRLPKLLHPPLQLEPLDIPFN
jgi:hypothetical protein